MKVKFEFSKKLGTQPVGEEVEMFSSTAAVLERKGFGKITKKLVKTEDKGENGIKKTWANLAKEDRAKLQLDESLVKKEKATSEK